ncbi:hypothetical protein [Halocynthiibacter sp.]|uniref:hypothetical protein n=1 Tax=Halocynthiibacter sp. TaxID=1979210 RepID=UPI003C391D0B
MNNLKPASTCIFFALMAGCATPYEQCVSFAHRDLYQTQKDIQFLESNIRRGYAVHSQSVPYTVAKECLNENEEPFRCDEVNYHTIETPVAIDISAEQRKLDRARADLPALRAEVAREVRGCQRQYPAG